MKVILVRWHPWTTQRYKRSGKIYHREKHTTSRGETVLNNDNTVRLKLPATAIDADQRPQCCSHNDGGISEHLIPAILRLRNKTSVIRVLIDNQPQI